MIKKGQTQQIFIFILAMLITAGIVVYGYTAIKDFGEKQEQVELITFQTQIENELDILLGDFGTIKRPPIKTPANVEYVCFGDKNNNDYANSPLCQDLANYPGALSRIACSAYEGGKSNVFLIPDGSTNFMAADNNLDVSGVPGKVLCIKTQRGQLKVQFESLGNEIKVTQAP